MLVLKGPIVYCDVDDTLVRWSPLHHEPQENTLTVLNSAGKWVHLEVITETVEALQRHAARGHNIVVWSAGGADWARRVVERLQLSSIVQACLDKPTWWYDDVTSTEVLFPHTRRDLSR